MSEASSFPIEWYQIADQLIIKMFFLNLKSSFWKVLFLITHYTLPNAIKYIILILNYFPSSGKFILCFAKWMWKLKQGFQVFKTLYKVCTSTITYIREVKMLHFSFNTILEGNISSILYFWLSNRLWIVIL